MRRRSPRAENARMTNHYHAFIWIDHRLAKVFHFNAEVHDVELVHSTHPEQHIHHKANSGDSGHAPVDKDYLERVVQAVKGAGAILIAGPSGAKIELNSLIKRMHPQLAEKICAVETLDHPTDGELLAHARHFFRADERMRLQA
jgi:stalled ribosome rescue protein Dom34